MRLEFLRKLNLFLIVDVVRVYYENPKKNYSLVS